MLEAGPAEHGDLPGRSELAQVTATVAEQAAAVPLLRRRWQGLPYWLILPTLGYLAVFFAWPMVKSFQLAFQDVAGNWSFDSIDRMYHDSEFKHALWFTLLLVVVIVPIQFVIAFVMALLVNANAEGTRPPPLHLHPAARRARTSRPASSGSRSSPTTAT